MNGAVGFGGSLCDVAANNESTVDDLLMISVQERESRTQRGAAQERWDSESGAAR